MGSTKSKQVKTNTNGIGDKPTVFFILGGPRSSKDSQCYKLKEKDFAHLSVRELLYEEAESGSKNAAMIQHYLKEEKLVPGEVPALLIKKAMEKNGWNKKRYLIDGFLRGQ